MSRDRSLLSGVVTYISVLGVVFIGIGLGLIGAVLGLTAAMNSAANMPQQESTWVGQQIESSRQIRQALATPLPASEPLPAITARATYPARIASSPAKVNRGNWVQARGAFTKIEPAPAEAPVSAYADFDRHAVH